MAVRRKVYIVLVCVTISLLYITHFAHKIFYIASYESVKIQNVTQFSDSSLYVYYPYWTILSTHDQIKNIENKYDVKIENCDLEKEMLIVSYGAELIGMEYNTKESTYRSRGCYIGFETFGTSSPNTIFVYKADIIPLISTEIAGFSPDYKGRYR